MDEYQDFSSGKVVSSVLARIERSSDTAKTKAMPALRLVKPTLSQSVSKGELIHAGSPVNMGDFDEAEDTILFAYDPEQTPDPEFALLNGTQFGEKILTMNGQHMVQIANASSLDLSDIMVIEIGLAA